MLIVDDHVARDDEMRTVRTLHVFPHCQAELQFRCENSLADDKIWQTCKARRLGQHDRRDSIAICQHPLIQASADTGQWTQSACRSSRSSIMRMWMHPQTPSTLPTR